MPSPSESVNGLGGESAEVSSEPNSCHQRRTLLRVVESVPTASIQVAGGSGLGGCWAMVVVAGIATVAERIAARLRSAGVGQHGFRVAEMMTRGKGIRWRAVILALGGRGDAGAVGWGVG